MARRGRERIKKLIRRPSKSARIKPPTLKRTIERDGWLDIARFPDFLPQSVQRHLKLCADEDAPLPFLTELRDMGYRVEDPREHQVNGNDDSAIAAWAKRSNGVLLSFNHRDFLNEHKHPCHTCDGMIVSGIPNQRYYELLAIMDAFNRVFVRRVATGWWQATKVIAKSSALDIRRHRGGRIIRHTVELVGERLRFKTK